MYKNILAVALLLYSFFGGGLLDLLDKIPMPNPEPAPIILSIDKPHEDVINRVEIFSKLVTDPSDKAKLAIFNYEFAERVIDYNATSQQVNDIYTLAGKIFFKDSLVDKYDGLAEEIVKLLKEIMGDDNHALREFEKAELNEYFMAIAWVLIHGG
jgi:hypothetical protein